MASSEIPRTAVLLILLPKQNEVKGKNTVIILSLTAVLAISCGRNGADGVDLLPYLGSVMADTSSVEHSVMAGYDPMDRYGDIAVIGPEKDTRLLTDYLMRCDMYDNVDAREMRDSLPDFAGEIFASYYDLADSSCTALFREGRDDSIRTVTVRNAVAAAASECYQNIFSNAPTEGKPSAKVMVFSSPYSEAGVEDADTLFSFFGKRLRVISPVRAIAERMTHLHVSGRVGIWAESDVLASGVYALVFRDWNYGFDYVGFSPEGFSTAEEGFFRFLDMYMSTGEVTPLAALVIDDFGLSAYADSISEVAARVNSSTADEYAVYRAILDDDFKVIDAVSAIARSCYGLLRNENLFTHRIQYPSVMEYAILPSAGGDTDIKYIRYNHVH